MDMDSIVGQLLLKYSEYKKEEIMSQYIGYL